MPLSISLILFIFNKLKQTNSSMAIVKRFGLLSSIFIPQSIHTKNNNIDCYFKIVFCMFSNHYKLYQIALVFKSIRNGIHCYNQFTFKQYYFFALSFLSDSFCTEKFCFFLSFPLNQERQFSVPFAFFILHSTVSESEGNIQFQPNYKY